MQLLFGTDKFRVNDDTNPRELFKTFYMFVSNEEANAHVRTHGLFCEGPMGISIPHGKLSHVISTPNKL